MARMRIAASLLFIGLSLHGLANGIAVSNIDAIDQDTNAKTFTISFDVAWQNSWRLYNAPTNWDAGWIFMKYRVNGGPWRHGSIASVLTIPSDATVDRTDDGVGMFVYRATEGTGDVTFPGITYQWDYGAVGVADGAEIEFRMFAIEMVYVPEGAFSLGSGGDAPYEFHKVDGWLLGHPPYPVSSEDAFHFGGATEGELTSSDLLAEAESAGPVPAEFPKGYGGFYCIKHEICQGQFVRFINTLAPAWQQAMDPSEGGIFTDVLRAERNGFYWAAPEEAATLYDWLPVGRLSVSTMLAYLDWAGLRPMTELEYEKACRGTRASVADEYAWGTTSLYIFDYTVVDLDTDFERVIPVGNIGNALYRANSPLSGPLRLGGFAAGARNNTRAAAGGSYYGILELSGNLQELAVSIGTTTGRSYTGEHGDGTLDENGQADTTGWPLTEAGYGLRGGGYDSSAGSLRVSNRSEMVSGFTSSGSVGFRGVRSMY